MNNAGTILFLEDDYAHVFIFEAGFRRRGIANPFNAGANASFDKRLGLDELTTMVKDLEFLSDVRVPVTGTLGKC